MSIQLLYKILNQVYNTQQTRELTDKYKLKCKYIQE